MDVWEGGRSDMCGMSEEWGRGCFNFLHAGLGIFFGTNQCITIYRQLNNNT